MVAIPPEILEIAGSPAAVKIMVTASPEGQPHAIVCGSVFVTPDGKAGVGEILMKRTKEYMKSGKVALAIAAGPKAFELVLANPVRADSGPQFEGMKAKLAEMKLPCFALWTFDVVEIWDESAGPTAGTKIA